MEILINLIPIITSIIISILYYKIQLTIKNQFDTNLKLLENELNEKFELKKQELEFKFKIKYDSETKLRDNLLLLNSKFMRLDFFIYESNYNDAHNKDEVNKIYRNIKEILMGVELQLNESLIQITESLFKFNNCIDYLDFHTFHKRKYEQLKNSFIEQLKNSFTEQLNISFTEQLNISFTEQLKKSFTEQLKIDNNE